MKKKEGGIETAGSMLPKHQFSKFGSWEERIWAMRCTTELRLLLSVATRLLLFCHEDQDGGSEWLNSKLSKKLSKVSPHSLRRVYDRSPIFF